MAGSSQSHITLSDNKYLQLWQLQQLFTKKSISRDQIIWGWWLLERPGDSFLWIFRFSLFNKHVMVWWCHVLLIEYKMYINDVIFRDEDFNLMINYNFEIKVPSLTSSLPAGRERTEIFYFCTTLNNIWIKFEPVGVTAMTSSISVSKKHGDIFSVVLVRPSNFE